MGVYIKGLDALPKGEEIRIINSVFGMKAINISTNESYDVVEVAEPHGRLIDASALEVYDLNTYPDAQKVSFAIDNAPTVIEATEK